MAFRTKLSFKPVPRVALLSGIVREQTEQCEEREKTIPLFKLKRLKPGGSIRSLLKGESVLHTE